ncbi:winged helix-turn-helix domain-containing protein [Streptomyces sp. MST-110588]|uniref:ArsR/SmtB family transcription factor n=1 Tax=Streptomyces sp. MST-110588 TaxID=2833628 RepID=UPI001F5DCA86|nr:winged helix-turn-helix domain-containing protein [Streptomyces sp. MST-110588]UNO39281.1 winged helix-turn-helix transcriptional regulator [Streptomyces sp. MST-110588]
MLRIHFTPEDLARVRVAPEPDYLWEIANSVQTLQRRDGAPVFGTWRGWARARLTGTRPLLSVLLPPRGYSPDFLTPSQDTPASLDTALDTLLSTPRSRLRTDLARLDATRPLPRWTSDLAEGDTETLNRLGEAIRTYHAQAIAPLWNTIHAHIDADRMLRMRSLLTGGVEGLLAGLGPHFRWKPPVLEVDYPVEKVLRLEGRGLLLQPSFFCWPAPVSLADADLMPVLVYPVPHDLDMARGPAPPYERPHPLGALLGNTRAAVLRTAVHGCSTSELARQLGVTAPAVSQHVAVLREAGLLMTVRQAGRALHVATAEGRALLRCVPGGNSG